MLAQAPLHRLTQMSMVEDRILFGHLTVLIPDGYVHLFREEVPVCRRLGMCNC